MNRLFALEYRKNLTYLAFWVVLGIHYFFLITFLTNLNNFAGSMNISTQAYQNIDLGRVPMFRFPDIWQNIVYLSAFFKILLGIFIVIAVTNEFQYNTIRLNLSAGLTRFEFILSKVLLIFFISMVSVILLFSLGMALGMAHEGSTFSGSLLEGTDFLLGYFVEIFFYMVLALFISVWLKKTGISIVVLLIYPLLIEPLIRWQTPDYIDRFFPVKSMDQINVFPFAKYFGAQVPNHIPVDSTLIACCWIVILITLSYMLLQKLDL